MSSELSDWYAVRCILELAGFDETHCYEERITLWRASSAEAAIARAEAEAVHYASAIEDAPHKYLGLAQCYHLYDEPADGAEVFSLLRECALSPPDYMSTFFATGTEREAEVGS